MRSRSIVLSIVMTALIAVTACAPEPGEVVRPTSLGSPQLPNIADPALLLDAGTTYVYGTSNWLRVPVVALTDLSTVHTPNEMYGLARDAMPSRPAWVATSDIWAPAVARLGGRYVLFFAAHRRNAPDPHNDLCVGRAVASSPVGPFMPDSAPVTCGNDGIHGALDPSVFVGPDGAAHLLVAMGGSATNIFTFPIDGNGNIAGPSVPLLIRAQRWQDWFLENPAMFFDGSTYLLAYSSGHWDTANYMTGVARCATPVGPCTDRTDGPWLQSIGERSGPGGLEFYYGPDLLPRVAFESFAAGHEGPSASRATTIARIAADPWPRLG